MEPVFPFDLRLPARGQGLLTRQLHGQLRAAILDGRLPGGFLLPSSRRVAEALGIARNTVVQVYDLLIAEGYAIPHKGTKATVAKLESRSAIRRKRSPRRSAELGINPLWQSALLQPSPPRELPERSFRLGIPEHRFFPHDVWRRLSALSLRAWSRRSFLYPPSEGIPELREAIARHVAFTRAVACAGDDVIVTSGAQQAFDLLARLLVTSGETKVAVEEPGYPPLRAAFVAAGARILPVPVDDEGLCVEQLTDDVRVISVTPSHQSPTGVALSLRRRAALLEFARTTGAVIIEDDYDGEFRFGGRPLDALQTLDRDARVFYVGTFSKSLFPALRKGFVVAPAWAKESLIAVKHCADSHCDTITQSVLAAFISEGHLLRHVRRMRPIYAERREALLAALADEVSPWLEPIPSEAGLHLSARIRLPERAAAIMTLARSYVPGAQSTADYAMNAPQHPALTFGYGVIDSGDITASLRRFGLALRSLGFSSP
ncbi:MAG: PLP-dependent aminotransferase family protein [Tahibacter sp.]